MPDALKISTISFRSQDSRSHPWVRRLYRDLSVTNGAWRLMRVWRTLSYCRASSVAFVFGYLIRSEFWISTLKASMLIDYNFRCLIVCGMVRIWLDAISKLATTEKWSEIKSEAETERALHPGEQIIRSREWPWMWVGKSTYRWRLKESKIPDSHPASDDEESIRRLKSPIRARSWENVDM